MASPISYINKNYKKYAGWWVKAYQPFTSTSKPIWFEAVEITSVDKIQISEDGFFKNLDGENTTLYLDEYFDLYLFETEELADADLFEFAYKIASDVTADKDLEDLNIPDATKFVFGIERFATFAEAVPPIVPDNLLFASPALLAGLARSKALETASDTQDVIDKDLSTWISPFYINLLLSGYIPPTTDINYEIGDIHWRHESEVDSDWLLCDGLPFDTAIYPDLFLLTDYTGGTTIDMSDRFVDEYTKLYVFAKKS